MKKTDTKKPVGGLPDPLIKQVGGQHYKSKGVQHVTFCQRNRIPWCESSAIKYLLRHKRKNGREDVEKAKHYIELCIWDDYVERETNPVGMRPADFAIPIAQFLKENNVGDAEAEIVTLILHHQVKLGETTLLEAIKLTDKLLQGYSEDYLLE
jgi:hypothetical protein